jgi:methanogenic corrinoid protein MtbC1
MTGVAREDVERMTASLLARDVDEARFLALQLLDSGLGIGEVLTHVIAPAQAEVGDRWLRDEASVADEHAATAVAETVVSIITGIARPPVTGPHVVVACAEGEWHLLAARLLGETLRGSGCGVTFLGASMPAAHLARFLRGCAPDVLAVSSTTPLTLEGVLSFVHVAHEVGIPVIAGGRGLGPDDRRARVLGADLWAPDALAAAALLAEPLPRRRTQPTAATGAAMELSLRLPVLVEAAMVRLGERFPPLAGYSPDQVARTREDFGYILQFAQAAILTRDATLFDDFLGWLEQLLVARGVPARALTLSIDILREVQDVPALGELLAGAAPA